MSSHNLASSSPESTPGDDDGARRSWTGSLRRGVEWFLVVCLATVALLQTPLVATQIARPLVRAFTPEGLDVDIGAVGWFSFTSLDLRDVRVTDSAGGNVFSAEHVEVDQRLWSILFGNPSVRILRVERGHLTLQARPDGRWGLGLPASSNVTPPPTTPSEPLLVIDRVRIEESRVDVVSAVPNGQTLAWEDTTVVIEGLRSNVADLAIRRDGTVLAKIDRAGGKVRLGITPQDYEIEFEVVGALEGSQATLPSVTLQGEQTELDGSLAVDWLSVAGGGSATITAALETPSLAPTDFRALAPAWKGTTPLQADIQITGTIDSLRLDLGVSAQTLGTAEGAVYVTGKGSDRGLDWLLSFKDLDPRVILGPDGPEGRFNGRTDASVTGPLPSEWSGNMGFELESSTLGKMRVRPSEVTLVLVNGLANGEGRVEVSQPRGTTLVTAAVTGRILDTVPTYGLSGSLVHSFVGQDQPPQVLYLVLELEGRGIAAEDQVLEASIQADPTRRTRVGATDLQDLNATVSIRPGAGDWSVQTRLASGSLTGRGQIERLPTQTRIRASSLAWDSLDVAAILGDSIPLRSSGDGRGVITIGSEGAVVSNGMLTARDAHFGSARLDSASVVWDLASGGRLESELAAWVGAGTVSARVSGAPLGSVPMFRLTAGTIQGFDLGSVLTSGPEDSLSVSTSLTGTFAGRWSGRLPESGQGQLQLSMVDSRINSADSISARGSFDLNDGTLSVDGSLESAAGDAVLAGSARPFDDRPTWGSDRVEFEHFVPSLWTGVANAPDAQTTWLQGSATASGVGFNPTEATARASVSLEGSAVAGRVLQQATIAAELEQSRIDATASFRADSARVSATGWVELAADSPSYSADVSAWLSDSDTVAALQGSLSGVGFDPATAEVSVDIALRPVSSHGIDVDRGVMKALLSDGLLRVDSLTVTGPTLLLQGGGGVGVATGTSSDFQAKLTMESLGFVRAVVGARPLSIGEGTVSVSVLGPFARQKLTGTASTNAMLLGELQLVGLEAEFDGVFERTELAEANLTAALQSLHTSTATVDQTDISARYDGDEIALDVQSAVDARRTLELSARVDPLPERRIIEVDRLTASMDEDQWQLVSPASVRYGSTIVVDSFDLRAGDQRVFASGTLSPRGPQDFEIQVKSFGIGTVSDLVGWTALQGEVSGSVLLGGTAAAPTLDVSWDSQLSSAQTPSVALRGTARYADSALELDARVLGENGHDLSTLGTIPLALRVPWSANVDEPIVRAADGAVDLEVVADSVAISWLRPVLDPTGLRNVAGRLSADIQISGTAADPRFDGHTTFRGGAIELEALGTRWEAIESTGSLEGSSFVLERLSMLSGEGTLTVEGSVDFARLNVGDFDISLTADRFEAVDNSLARGTLSGEGRLDGTTAQPELRAEVQLLSTNVFLGGLKVSSQAADVELTEDDYRELEATFGRDYRQRQSTRSALADSLDVRINVAMGRDTWVRQSANPQMAIQISGDVEVTKPRGDSLSIVGEVEAVPERSFIEQFGRRFKLSGGTLAFRGPPSETRIDIQGTYSVPSVRNPDQAEVTIELGVEGTPAEVNILLSSTPSMDNSDIVSYLATGRPASQDVDLGGGDGAGLADFGAGIAIDAVANSIEGAAAERIGLDVIDIETDGLEGARLVAGRYVSPSLFVGFKQPLSRGSAPDRTRGASSGTEVEIEYQALKWLLLNLQAGGRGFDFLLRSRVAY